ncbi:MAG: GNAT family N-acetyltransferase [Cellvibrionaceae bacterium]
MKDKTIIRIATTEDLIGVSDIHKKAFIRQKNSAEWMQCILNSFPRSLCFVMEEEKDIIGYIVWTQKSGFRDNTVLELEQIAILPPLQSKGLGKKLVKHSLSLTKIELKKSGSIIKHILVSTRSDNSAQKLYKKVLGAKIECTITDLYSHDEVIMISRNIEI